MKLKGKAFVFGNNVNTDEIIPARHLNRSDPAELARHVMEGLRPGFGCRGDLAGAVIIAGDNFGCGSSREHAPLAIKAAGIAAVVARSFARIFLRNAVNIGLPIVELAETGAFREGDEIAIDLTGGEVSNRTSGGKFPFQPYPEFLQQIISAGGWLEFVRLKLWKKPGKNIGY